MHGKLLFLAISLLYDAVIIIAFLTMAYVTFSNLAQQCLRALRDLVSNDTRCLASLPMCLAV